VAKSIGAQIEINFYFRSFTVIGLEGNCICRSTVIGTHEIFSQTNEIPKWRVCQLITASHLIQNGNNDAKRQTYNPRPKDFHIEIFHHIEICHGNDQNKTHLTYPKIITNQKTKQAHNIYNKAQSKTKKNNKHPIETSKPNVSTHKRINP
jgi:hypothetical protein